MGSAMCLPASASRPRASRLVGTHLDSEIIDSVTATAAIRSSMCVLPDGVAGLPARRISPTRWRSDTDAHRPRQSARPASAGPSTGCARRSKAPVPIGDDHQGHAARGRPPQRACPIMSHAKSSAAPGSHSPSRPSAALASRASSRWAPYRHRYHRARLALAQRLCRLLETVTIIRAPRRT